MVNQDLFLRFGAALLIGVLIGMQREYAHGLSKGKGLFAGAADLDAITLSIIDLTRLGGTISLNTGKIAIILATISNTLAKGALVYSLGSKSLRKFVLPVIALMLVIGLGFIILV
jgi:uncharacterized membrane protein (DUF4010 family)